MVVVLLSEVRLPEVDHITLAAFSAETIFDRPAPDLQVRRVEEKDKRHSNKRSIAQRVGGDNERRVGESNTGAASLFWTSLPPSPFVRRLHFPHATGCSSAAKTKLPNCGYKLGPR